MPRFTTACAAGEAQAVIPQLTVMADEPQKPDDQIVEYARAVEDLHHQLKSPVVQAYRLAQVALDELDGIPNADNARREVARVVALLAKVSGTMLNSQLFAKLSQGESVELHATPIGESALLRMINEVLNDMAYLLTSHSNIRFASLVQMKDQEIVADKTLFEQALRNVLENAVKYSYRDTTVKIATEVSNPGKLALSVQNTGLPISVQDIEEIFERGWRGDAARRVTGEGSGIGLWISKNIMTAHGGDITVDPTNSSGRTTFRLTLPSRPK